MGRLRYAAFLLAIGCGYAYAQTDGHLPRKRVLVLPVRDYRIEPASLFSEAKPRTDASAAEAIFRILESEPEVEALTPKAIRPNGSAGVAEGFLNLGIDLYRNLRVEEAIRALQKAVEAGRAEFLDILNPHKMFAIFLYLGLCYLEQNSPALAHVAFRNMFLVAPQEAFSRPEFRHGYFPKEVEEAIRAAAEDLVRSPPPELFLGTQERAADLLRVASAKALVEVTLTGGGQTPEVLFVRVHEASLDGTIRTILARSHELNAEGFAEYISRDISVWLACTDLPSRSPAPKRFPFFFMDTTGAYLIFLGHGPVRNVFHNAGFGFGVSYQIQKELDVFGRVNLLTSFPDKYSDLIATFTSVRIHTGIGYTMQGKWGRFFVHTGLDVQYLTNFASSTDPFCKVPAWRDDESLCQPSHIEHLPYRVLGGAAVTIGVDVMLFGPIFFTAKAGASSYFFPATPTASLNFPIVGELGLGYAFW